MMSETDNLKSGAAADGRQLQTKLDKQRYFTAFGKFGRLHGKQRKFNVDLEVLAVVRALASHQCGPS